ncbi:MAG: carbohydrate binding family 9 domain-containing protein [Acidobacteria bacterium]|nr:carbohydrate binding family 9 domain-containing protein [Acidobacteriota bacterium]
MIRPHSPFWALLWLALLAPAASLLEASDRPAIDYKTARFERRLPAVRATGQIALDGTLDEADWQTAPVATGFIQNEPREGEPATEQTEVRVLYDNQYLYFGVFAHDSNPGAIITNDLKKDFSANNSDSFEIVLDTFHDERNGYQFAINTAGAKWDAQMVNEGREINSNWDGIWSVKTRVTEVGWYAEIAIPFRTLRFSNLDPQTWGVNFLRRVRRRNEDSTWAPLPRIYDIQRVSLAGTIEGLQHVRPGTDLRVKPYVLTSAGAVGGAATTGDFNGGFDAKYGVTSGLTWDFTVNTDFSQVEADEQQVNLTRFSLFFPEKRDFFLENSGVFQFGAGNERGQGGLGGGGGGGGAGGGGGGGGGRLNVGRDELLFFSRRVGLSSNGNSIPILAGTRLTGHAGPYIVGVMNIQQRQLGDSPATNFTALRLRRDVLANSDIGLLVLNKDSSGPRFNRVVGADANFRFFRKLDLTGYAAKTLSPQDVMPGQGRDVMARAGIFLNDSFWNIRWSYLTIGGRFNDEMGYVQRTNVNRLDGFLGMHFRPARTSRWLREIYPHWQLVNVDRIGRGLESRYVDYHLPFQLQDGTFIELGINPSTDVLFDPFTINSKRSIVIAPGRYGYPEYFALVRSNSSARMSFNFRWGTGDFYDGHKRSYQVGGTVRLNERFNASLNYSYNDIDLTTGAYSTNLITSRVIYSFNTRMFLNALLQYNTDAEQWSSNIRFNIIHRPLSDFYLVYNERHDSRTGEFLDRALVAKMTYMVAF